MSPHEYTPAPALSPRERAILDVIQCDFPLAADPYAEIGARVGCAREDAHALTQALRRNGIIRRIGASFDSRRVGYHSVLVAARVAPEELESVAAAAGDYPEVTHNYQRDHRYNLWFTVIAETPERLQQILHALRHRPGVLALHGLPALRTFKIRVDFTFEQHNADALSPSRPTPPPDPAPLALDVIDRRLITRLCGDLDTTLQPFTTLAAELGISDGDLLTRVRDYRSHGLLRRFGAILRHQQAGMTANGMSVWRVPADAVERVGACLAAQPEISHCYERPPMPDWTYNLYAMIHARSNEECRQLTQRLAVETGITDYALLYSLREFKKTSMVYHVAIDS